MQPSDRRLGVAEAGARATRLDGTIAAPMLGLNGEVKDVLGVGRRSGHEFPEDEERLLRIGRRIAECW